MDFDKWGPLAFLLAVLVFLAAMYIAIRIGGGFND